MIIGSIVKENINTDILAIKVDYLNLGSIEKTVIISYPIFFQFLWVIIIFL